jgi:putative nucleotidyltransferase with HDIG domain
MMHVIKDAVHGNIRISDVELKLIDTPEMQRLRGIKQMAVAYLVYPGANHTRFEHSLGTMHITGEICENLSLSDDETKTMRAAALLHDVGHTAFSHENEGILVRKRMGNHEQRGVEVVREGRSGGILEESGYDVKRVCSIIGGEERCGIINFDLGSDRMDYLLRDSHYTGVAYGVIDCDRLVHTIRLKGGKAVVEWGGIEAAESLLIARFLMFSSVYYHHAVRIASAMLGRAVEFALEDEVISLEELLCCSDAELGSVLERGERSGRLLGRIRRRELYKRAYELEFHKLNARGMELFRNYWKMREAERKIREESGVEDVILECRQGYDEKFGESRVSILKGAKEYPLEELSEIVGAIRRTEEMRRRAIVACPKGDRGRVESACKRFFKKFIKDYTK